MTVYHVEWWREQTSNDDCIHCAVVDLGYYLRLEDAVKKAKQYPKQETTISEIPVIETL